MPSLVLKNVSVVYNENSSFCKTALDDVNIEFPEGEKAIDFIRQMLDEEIFTLNGDKIRFNKK